MGYHASTGSEATSAAKCQEQQEEEHPLLGVDCGILRKPVPDCIVGSFTPVIIVRATTEALSVLQAQVIILDCIRCCVLSANQETCMFCS